MNMKNVPPIRGNSRIGHETKIDLSSGVHPKLPTEPKQQKSKSKTKVRKKGNPNQLCFTLKRRDELEMISKRLGLSMSAVINLAISQLAQNVLK